jgi:hypothetical protein
VDIAALVRKSVAIADTLTASAQATVQHAAATIVNGVVTRDANGRAALAAPVARQAFVNTTAKLIVRADGKQVLVIATVTFPRPVVVTVEDIFTLPDGTVGRVIDAGGPDDPGTGTGYVTKVRLGAQ